MSCVFCHREQIATDMVYEDEMVMAFMDMDPINEGPVLLATKEHYHLHIFPRYENDGFGWTYGEGPKAVSTEIAKKIRENMLVTE